jgi:uncharacterized protein (UPF0276 family)
MPAFDLKSLPRLGVGISGEFDSSRTGIDAVDLKEQLPHAIDFMEFGADLDRGLDEHVRRWAARGWATTYHFLDVNLEEPEDVDEAWLARTAAAAREIGASWLCGDGGLWHFGPRDRGHMTLMPPVLDVESAAAMARAVAHVQAATGMACLPENPPATVYLGPLHILDYFARVADEGGCGVLLDCAHLAIFQRARGHAALDGLDGFPMDRIVEVHVAGGGERVEADGFRWIEDDHSPEPLPETWAIYEHVAARAKNLTAVVYECERNAAHEVVDGFARIREVWDAGASVRGGGA